MAEGKFDLKLVPEYNGTMSVVDWLERVDLIDVECPSSQSQRDYLLTTTLRSLVRNSGSFSSGEECACGFGVPMCWQATAS